VQADRIAILFGLPIGFAWLTKPPLAWRAALRADTECRMAGALA
jgi:hypothetical protein